MRFIDWDDRPAVLFSDEPPCGALAKLSPSAPWTPVDFFDVSSEGAVLSEARWRAEFTPRFGPLDPPTSMPTKPSAPLMSETLTPAEIESLRQSKREAVAFAQRAFAERWAATVSPVAKDPLSSLPSDPGKPAGPLLPENLTSEEIDALRQDLKKTADYALKAFAKMRAEKAAASALTLIPTPAVAVAPDPGQSLRLGLLSQMFANLAAKETGVVATGHLKVAKALTRKAAEHTPRGETLPLPLDRLTDEGG